jgi:hypothetical protein
MKSALLFLSLFLSANLFGQNVNIPDMKLNHVSIIASANWGAKIYGGSLHINTGEREYLFYSINGGVDEIGELRTGYDNEGVYSVGLLGNTFSGVSEAYEKTTTVSHCVGFGYKVFKHGAFSISPQLGFGIAHSKKTTNRYDGAEDVTSGVNVLGNYWINSGTAIVKTTSPFLSAGLMFNIAFIKLGVGYDFFPSGFTTSIGINF